MKKMMSLSVRILCFCIVILSAGLYGQTSTVTLNYSQRQGAYKQCGLSSCSYFSTSGDVTLYSDGTGGSSETKNARYLFDHPGFANNKIKKIVLEIQISKIFNSTTLDAGMNIKVPNSSCNNTIPWSGNVNYESLFNCNNTGNSVFNDGVGTPNTSATTFNLLIYDSEASGLPSQTLSYLDPNSTSFTFAFSPYVGGVTIHSAKVHVTYENTTTPTVPATPSLTASASSPNSILLSWNTVANAASYQIVDCSNQYVATTTTNSYSVTGLTPTYTYGYKVKAVNSAGSSAYSACKYATTPSGVTGCTSSINSLTPTGLTTLYSGAAGAMLSWSPVTYADAYEVWHCETNTLLTEVTTTQYFIPRALFEPGQNHSFKIKAVDYCSGGGAKLSKFSACYFMVNVPCQDSPFNNNSVTFERGETWLRLNWSHSGMGNYVYEIYNCTTNQLVATTYNNQYQFNNLSPGTQYLYKIRAKGCTPPSYNSFSNCLAITTLGCPSNVSITNTTFGASVNYEASNSVSIANSTFESGSNGTLQAANVIVITPETHYKNGSNIVIKTGNCTSVSGKITEAETMPEYENLLYEYKFPVSAKSDDSQIKVYPNPVHDRVTITSDMDLKNITIIAIDGKRVLDKKVNAKTEVVDLSVLENGVYLMSIEAQNGKITVEKIIKK